MWQQTSFELEVWFVLMRKEQWDSGLWACVLKESLKSLLAVHNSLQGLGSIIWPWHCNGFDDVSTHTLAVAAVGPGLGALAVKSRFADIRD